MSLPHRATLVLLIAALALTAWSGPSAWAEEPSKDEVERRKKLIRLGSGTVKLPEPVGQVYPLESLLERCMEVNPQVVARQHKELFARARASEANWGSFPTFEVTSTFTVVPAQTNPNQVSSNIDKYLSLDVGPFSATSVRMVIPIFTFGKLDAAQELAQLGIDQEELESQKLRLKLLTQTRQAYYSLQLGKQIQGLIGDSVDVMRQEIDRLEEAREFGDENVDVVELRKLQIYETEISAKVLDNQHLVDLTREALAVLVQLESNTFDVTPFDEEVDTSLLLPAADYVAIARENRPDVKLLQKAIAAREQQVKLERARFWPDIFFAADFSLGYSTEEARDQQGFVSDPDGEDLPIRVKPFSNPYNYTRFGFLFGARLKYSPAGQYFKLQQAEAQLAETQGLRRAAVEGIELQIKKQWAEVNAERQRVEIYQRRLKAADRWRKQIGIAFESGGAEFEDFLNPIKAYYEARLKLLEAQYNYQVGLAKLGEQVGVTDIQSLSRELAKQKEAPSK